MTFVGKVNTFGNPCKFYLSVMLTVFGRKKMTSTIKATNTKPAIIAKSCPKLPASVDSPSSFVMIAPAKTPGHVHDAVSGRPIARRYELAEDRHVVGVENTESDTETEPTADNHGETVAEP